HQGLVRVEHLDLQLREVEAGVEVDLDEESGARDRGRVVTAEQAERQGTPEPDRRLSRHRKLTSPSVVGRAWGSVSTNTVAAAPPARTTIPVQNHHRLYTGVLLALAAASASAFAVAKRAISRSSWRLFSTSCLALSACASARRASSSAFCASASFCLVAA